MALRWENVDLAGGTIRVVSTHGFRTKNYRIRKIPISSRLNAFLAALPHDHATVIKPNADKKMISRLFKRACRRAGVPAAIHFHSLRHTFASWLVQAGVDIYRVKELLGHTDIKTTMIYTHLYPADYRADVEKIVF